MGCELAEGIQLRVCRGQRNGGPQRSRRPALVRDFRAGGMQAKEREGAGRFRKENFRDGGDVYKAWAVSWPKAYS